MLHISFKNIGGDVARIRINTTISSIKGKCHGNKIKGRNKIKKRYSINFKFKIIITSYYIIKNDIIYDISKLHHGILN